MTDLEGIDPLIAEILLVNGRGRFTNERKTGLRRALKERSNGKVALRGAGGCAHPNPEQVECPWRHLRKTVSIAEHIVRRGNYSQRNLRYLVTSGLSARRAFASHRVGSEVIQIQDVRPFCPVAGCKGGDS